MTLVGSGTFFIRHYYDATVRPIVATSVTFALVISIIGLALQGAIRAPIAYRVTFKRSDEDVSFVRRNRDSLILSLIFFILGIITTVAFQYFR
jgi:hypothetical protein